MLLFEQTNVHWTCCKLKSSQTSNTYDSMKRLKMEKNFHVYFVDLPGCQRLISSRDKSPVHSQVRINEVTDRQTD